MTTHQRAYRYRFYPMPEQALQLAQSFGCARYVYNWGLAQSEAHWQAHKKRLSADKLSGMLTQIKAEESTAWLNDVSSVVLQQSLRHLKKAYEKFFKKTAKKPRFKKKQNEQPASYMDNAFTRVGQSFTLAKQKEPLQIRWSRPLPKDARVSSLTVTKEASGRYFVSLLVEEDIAPLPVSDSVIGLDLGIKALVTPSHGKVIANPKLLEKKLYRLKRYQRCQARKLEAAMGLKGKRVSKGTRIPKSNNFQKASRQVARLHAQVRDARDDYLHKLSTALIRENQTIGVESLNVAGMVKNRRLARSISDAAFGRLIQMLEYKAAWYGRTIVKADRWYPSSKLCSACGHKLDDLPLKVRAWTCPACSAEHDRDQNAARNLLSVALDSLSDGSDAIDQPVPRGTREFTSVRHLGAT